MCKASKEQEVTDILETVINEAMKEGKFLGLTKVANLKYTYDVVHGLELHFQSKEKHVVFQVIVERIG